MKQILHGFYWWVKEAGILLLKARASLKQSSSGITTEGPHVSTCGILHNLIFPWN